MRNEVLLTGILPTLRIEDLGIDNLTPELRYQHLNEALFRGRAAITVVIDGIDQYQGTYNSVVLEGANTSLQLHLQVDPAESAQLYNLAQLITAPLLAAATNSPVLLGRRLWHETRVAVFERSLDSRSESQVARGSLTRVTFGDAWVRDSIIELFRDNVARFPVLLMRELDENSLDQVARGEAQAGASVQPSCCIRYLTGFPSGSPRPARLSRLCRIRLPSYSRVTGHSSRPMRPSGWRSSRTRWRVMAWVRVWPPASAPRREQGGG